MSIGSWPGQPTPPYRPDPARPGWPLPPEPPTPEVEPVPRRSHPVMVPIVDLPRARDVRRVVVVRAARRRIDDPDRGRADGLRRRVGRRDRRWSSTAMAARSPTSSRCSTSSARCGRRSPRGASVGPPAARRCCWPPARADAAPAPTPPSPCRDRDLARIEGPPSTLQAQLDDLEPHPRPSHRRPRASHRADRRRVAPPARRRARCSTPPARPRWASSTGTEPPQCGRPRSGRRGTNVTIV